MAGNVGSRITEFDLIAIGDWYLPTQDGKSSCHCAGGTSAGNNLLPQFMLPLSKKAHIMRTSIPDFLASFYATSMKNKSLEFCIYLTIQTSLDLLQKNYNVSLLT